MRRDLGWMILIVVLAGCMASRPDNRVGDYPDGPTAPVKANPKSSTKPSPVIVTPANVNAGKITSVNPGARFVVITYALGNLPATNARLNIYRAGLKVGEVKITGPARDNNTVADIVAGECQSGDEVRED